MKIHMVKKGDTLYFIAQKYNVSLEELIQANPDIANPDEIDVGMKVKIPTPATPAIEMMHHHTVQQGDTLWKLSKAWGIPLSDMIKANPQLKNPNVLLTGEVVHIPKPSAPGSEFMPQAVSMQPASGMIPGKKNTAVVPETVAPEAVTLPEPVYPMPAPEQVSEIQEAPAMPIKEEAHAPKHPKPEHKQVYPEHKQMYPEHKQVYPEHPEHKQVYPEHKHPYPETYPHAGHHPLFAQFPIPAMEAVAPAAHQCHPADYGKMHPPMQSPLFAQSMPAGHEYDAYGHHADHVGYGYGDMSYGMPSSVQGAAGSMYNPADMSGYGAKSDEYGDLSQTGAAAPHGLTGYMQGQVAPAAGAFPPAYGMPHTHGGCGCGGAMPMPVHGGYGWPFGAYMPVAPMAQMNPWYPMTNPAMVAPSESDGYARTSDGGSPNTAGYPLPATLPLPTYSSVPAISGQGSKEHSQTAAEGESPLNLHHVDDTSAAASSSSHKKRTGSGKPKRPARKAKPQRKQNLPWIR